MDPSQTKIATRPSRTRTRLPVALLGFLALACLFIMDVPPAVKLAGGLTTVATIVRGAIGKVTIHRHAIPAGERRLAHVGGVCALSLPAVDETVADALRRRKSDRHLTLQLWIGPVLWELCCREIPIVR